MRSNFYCPELHLVLEIDGEVHEEAGSKENDAIRDAIFKEVGITTIRIKIWAMLTVIYYKKAGLLYERKADNYLNLQISPPLHL